MPRARKTCSTPGCPEIVERGRCTGCNTKAEQRRGSPQQRGYDQAHRSRFRAGVLRRDVVCRCDQPGQHGHGTVCSRPSHHADHWPLSRDELVRQHLDPNDPIRGRGLCHRCHSGETARLQPGGWNSR